MKKPHKLLEMVSNLASNHLAKRAILYCISSEITVEEGVGLVGGGTHSASRSLILQMQLLKSPNGTHID